MTVQQKVAQLLALKVRPRIVITLSRERLDTEDASYQRPSVPINGDLRPTKPQKPERAQDGLFDLTNTNEHTKSKRTRQRKTGAYGLDLKLGDEMLRHNSPEKAVGFSIPAPTLSDHYDEDEYIITRR